MMFSLLACVCFGSIFSGYVSGFSHDFAFYFPSKGVTDYSQIWGMPSLTGVTVCFWMKSSAEKGSPFSYAVAAHENELLLYFDPNFHLWIGNSEKVIQVSANDGNWHHICATWNKTGQYQFYKDGINFTHGGRFGLKAGYTIHSGGSLMLGQEQDSLGGGLGASQSFQGMLSNVNLWDIVLTSAEILKLSKYCLAGEGSVYKWTYFIHGIRGNTGVVIPSPCSG